MMIDDLIVVEGFIDGDCFVMRGIDGHAVYGRYSADNLYSLARLIVDGEPFSFTIDDKKRVPISVELIKQIKKELNMIAKELE